MQTMSHIIRAQRYKNIMRMTKELLEINLNVVEGGIKKVKSWKFLPMKKRRFIESLRFYSFPS